MKSHQETDARIGCVIFNHNYIKWRILKMVKESANKEAVKAVVAEVKPADAAKKEEKKVAAPKAAAKKAPAKKAASKKAPAKKLGKIIFEVEGQQIDLKAIEKKAAKLGGDVYVVAAEKKIFDTNGNAVELF